MTDIEFIQELKAIIAEEAARFKLEELRETDYTIERIMTEQGLTKSQARKVLNEIAERGRFERIRIRNPNGGGARIAYRPIEKQK